MSKKIQILSKYCEPRMTLLIGVATEVVVVFLLIITLPNATFRLVDTKLFPFFNFIVFNFNLFPFC